MTEQKRQYVHFEELDDLEVDGEILEEDILHDYTSSGREVPWVKNKMGSTGTSCAYWTAGQEDIEQCGSDVHGFIKKAARMQNCAPSVQFRYVDGKLKLFQVFFCRIRLCPMCQYRKSLKVFGQVSDILREIEKDKHYSYIMLTLTVKNVSGNELSGEIDNLMTAWNRFIGLKPIKQVVKGSYRAMEVTHNIDYSSPNFDTYHPHFHCLFAVNPSYFRSRDYLSQAKWRELWKQAARLDYDPEVRINRVGQHGGKSLQSAVAETAKYAVKPGDYFIPDDWDLSVDSVRVLDHALHNRRFVAFGGVFKDAKKKLKLDDVETGDLIHIDKDAAESSENDPLVTYFWRSGYCQYVRGL